MIYNGGNSDTRNDFMDLAAAKAFVESLGTPGRVVGYRDGMAVEYYTYLGGVWKTADPRG